MNTVVDPTVLGTIVFTDIVGFTAFTAEQGDQRALTLLAAQEQLVRQVMPDDGRLVKELGDGLMLWFPDACSAITTCVELQDQVDTKDSDTDFPLWLRMGAHWGHQIPRRDDFVGHDVNVAARIVDMAAPREVLVSEATWKQVAGVIDGVEFVEVGPARMKGIPDPIWLYRASSTGSAR